MMSSNPIEETKKSVFDLDSVLPENYEISGKFEAMTVADAIENDPSAFKAIVDRGVIKLSPDARNYLSERLND